MKFYRSRFLSKRNKETPSVFDIVSILKAKEGKKKQENKVLKEEKLH